MHRRDRRHGHRSGGRFLRWAPVVLVLAILAAGVASYRFDLGARWFGTGTPEGPAEVAPPEGLELPGLTAPELVAQTASGPATAAAKVRRALAPLLDADDLGSHVVATVTALDGTPVLSSGDGVATPASTLKLLTAAAALAALGPDHRFSTTVVGDGDRVVLVGGGDPLLARAPARPGDGSWPQRADVATLARATAEALREQGHRSVRVAYDDSLFTGPAVNPAWEPTYVPEGVVSPITSLWVDEGYPAVGLGRVDDPSLVAAQTFAAALARTGITVRGTPQRAAAPDGAAELARVDSAPLSDLVEHVLSTSDNEGAEVLLRHVGLAVADDASARAGARAVLDTLDGLGVPTRGAVVKDGSGLSRQDLLRPETLAGVLAVAASDDHPELRPVVTGLPVAGFSGSLETRFGPRARDARGVVRAKTGTLSGVSGLAGIATDADGTPVVFVVLADEVGLDTDAAREALDEVAEALATCSCAA